MTTAATGARECPACLAQDSRPFGSKSGHALVRCASCKTIFTRDSVQREVLHDVYEGYYDDTNLAPPAFVMKRLQEILHPFGRHRATGRLLDVGFGAGTLLGVAREEGWAVSGVEVSERAVQEAAGRGFDVFCGSLAEARYPTAHFDVVTAVEVLEHLVDPLAVLREIVRVLRPGGLLWMTTPHGRGISARLLGPSWSVVSPPEHIQLFTTRGMRALLGRAGFKSVRLALNGVNPYEILNHYRGRELAPGDRVESSYQLNELMSAKPSVRIVKRTANAALSALRLGDGIKVYATT